MIQGLNRWDILILVIIGAWCGAALFFEMPLDAPWYLSNFPKAVNAKSLSFFLLLSDVALLACALLPKFTKAQPLLLAGVCWTLAAFCAILYNVGIAVAYIYLGRRLFRPARRVGSEK